MKKLTKGLTGLHLNLTAFVSFMCFYLALSVGVVMPVLKNVSYIALQLSGLRYLTAENFQSLFFSPSFYVFLIVIGLVYGCFELFEISGILFILDASEKQKQVNLMQTVCFSACSVKNAFRKHNIGILPIVLFMTPVYHLGTAINLLNSYSLFAIVIRTFQRHVYWRLAAALGLCFYSVLFFCLFFVVHIYVLEALTCQQAIRKSRRFMRNKGIKKLANTIGLQIIFALFFIVFNIGILGGIGLLNKSGVVPGSVVSTVQVIFMRVSEQLFDAMIVPVLLSSIGVYYYQSAADTEKRVQPLKQFDHCIMKITGHGRKIEIAALLFCVGSALVLIGMNARSEFTLRIEHLRTVEVSAHRGASMFYPENTMAAFVGAQEQGAAWIELDVQETKDGVIVVMHDSNLKRTTGVDRNIWEVTYEDLKDLDAGSFFNDSFKNEKIPLLTEVLAFAKENNIKLNIEIKPTGYEKNLVTETLLAVEEAEYEENCVITSQKYDVLKQVKELNEEIYTVYVMGLAYGAINRLTAADAFSIRSNSITQSLVTDLHNRGLEVYAWTVDSRANINRMINMGVDNIITNNVPLAIECINISRTESIFAEIMRMFFDRFR